MRNMLIILISLLDCNSVTLSLIICSIFPSTLVKAVKGGGVFYDFTKFFRAKLNKNE